ncbi:MAG TPA: F0F1 ATP synthase subunit B [Acidimicrobiales bacterium]|nr:F0F1 ATP synthase subunit B [Acidimicrobiales bacterium]
MLASSSGNFLVPDGTFIAEFIAFLLIVGIVAKWILPPLNRAMQARQEEIRGSLEAAEAAKAEADETRAQRQGILDEARGQGREIVTQANRTAERLRAEGEERGRQEYERMLSSATAEITLARQRAVDEVSAQVAGLVLAAARQVVGREIDAATHRDLIDEAIAALRSAGASASASGSAPTSGSGSRA